MDSLILMAESLCRCDSSVSLHLTVPDAPPSVRAWAETRPGVALSTVRPTGVTGWDVKPWLLLQQLNEGEQEALWLDSDIVVTRPVSSLVGEFSRDSFLVAEEWGRWSVPVSQLWGLQSARPMRVFNNCFVRATRTHRPLLERWLQMIRDPRYREAQRLPFEQRPIHLLHDGWPLIALLESREFGDTPCELIRRGRHIAQCAGSSGYRVHDRLLDLLRGLPALIHGLGRKPWESTRASSRIQRYMLDVATDVSPYVLASQRAARGLHIAPPWLQSRTSLGAALRALTAGHPGMAGLPMALIHTPFRIASMALARSRRL